MTLDPLATLDDLEERITADALSSTEVTRAEALLRDASATVRLEAGQEFTAGTSTLVRLRLRNGIVRLPQRPVTAVTAVHDDYGNAVTYRWLGDDRLALSAVALNEFELAPYRTPLGEVLVSYAHGGDVPDLVVAITCNVVLRALGRDPRDGAIIQETVAGYTYQTGAVGGAGPVGLLAEEKLRLEAYRRPHSASRQGL